MAILGNITVARTELSAEHSVQKPLCEAEKLLKIAEKSHGRKKRPKFVERTSVF